MFEQGNRDPRPIYEQVVENVRKLIVSGILMPEDKLPSVRQMAKKYAINPNTIARAYRQLEAEGYIYTASGKGTFVASGTQRRDERRNELFSAFDQVGKELLFLEVKPEELINRIRMLNREKEEKQGKV